MQYYMGIDPGLKSGALAIISKNKDESFAFDLPADLDEQARFIKSTYFKFKPALTIIEKQWARPISGKVASFGIGAAYHNARATLVCCGAAFDAVSPMTWKKDILRETTKSKKDSLVFIRNRFPSLELTRKKDHNKADAACICLWGIENG